ncbi:MAG: hypothetical protein PHF74_03565 [Dehalococcoidales bacterium]|nr:hypothetical protein [Dehalococcoidales bacterium]
MKKLKLFLVLALVTVACISPVTGCQFFSDKVVLTDENRVSQSESDAAALYWMNNSISYIPSWEGAELSAPVIYRYVADATQAIAYEYTVLKNGESAGHIIVPACKDLQPVLEFSDGNAPSSYMESARQHAVEKGYITDNEEPLILYWGATTYSVQFGNEMEKNRVAIHLPTGMLENIPRQMYTQIDKTEARASWDNLEQLIASNMID